MRLAAILPLFLLLLLGSAGTTAQAPPAPPAAAGDLVVIHAGTLLDRPGRAPRRNASILVRGNRIEAVQDGFVAPPAGARLIDLSDRFVLPGLIDSHVHLTSDRAGVEGQLAEVTDSVALRAYEAAWNAGKTLQAGFTTVRNLGSDDGVTPSPSYRTTPGRRARPTMSSHCSGASSLIHGSDAASRWDTSATCCGCCRGCRRSMCCSRTETACSSR